VVSHDRAFLERTVTDVVVLDERTPGRRLPGGYAKWEEARRAARSAPRPKSSAPKMPSAKAKPSGPSPSTLRQRLKDVEKDLRALDKRRAKATAALEGAGSDVAAIAAAGTALADVEAEIAAAEERWLELSTALDEG
jgi:ATP-binding cassette subfamily F protein uup